MMQPMLQDLLQSLSAAQGLGLIVACGVLGLAVVAIALDLTLRR